jgi:hypothetical protein
MSFRDRQGYGYGFLYLAGCALVVALGVGTVLGDTLARHDRADAAWGVGRGGSHSARGVREGKPGVL